MNKRKRRFGDRNDGWKLRGINPYESVGTYLMVNRNESCNLFADKFDISAAEDYIRQKQKQGLAHFGMLHLIIAAYVRTVASKPYLNRFISGQKAFARNTIQVNMTVKSKMTSDAPDTVIKVFFEPTDTAEDVYKKFIDTYNAAFAEEENDFDGTARIINYIPGLLKKFTVWSLKLLDYFGLLPKSLLNVSPFHGSFYITSLGSLGIPPVFHHLYNFGNVPMFFAFGAKRTAYELNSEGEAVKKRYIDYTFVTDERICDGYAYASAVKTFKRYLTNPTPLDTPPSEVLEDPLIDKPKREKKKKKEKKSKQS